MAATDIELKAAIDSSSNREWSTAEAASRRVLRVHPTNPLALYVLASAIADRGDDLESIRLLQQALRLDGKLRPAYHSLSHTYYNLGRLEDAARLYEAWSAVEPDNPEVQHMKAALTQRQVPDRCSDGYVSSHFDEFSQTFDDVLVNRLAYKGAEILVAILEKAGIVPDGTLRLLDAGCGTGLCGSALRPFCQTLVGVDLSEKMIERARKRECYDELVVSEMCAFMNTRPEAFDVVVSSDVLVYVGALEPVMMAAERTIKPRGAFAFALEALDQAGIEPYRLTPSGRYAHRDDYLRDVIGRTGLELVSIGQECVRWEGGRRVMFHCVAARKP